MKTVDILRDIFNQIDEAKKSAQIESLGVEVALILEQNAQKPIEGITDFLFERANILKHKVGFVAKSI
jgi:hypothetical protein